MYIFTISKVMLIHVVLGNKEFNLLQILVGGEVFRDFRKFHCRTMFVNTPRYYLLKIFPLNYDMQMNFFIAQNNGIYLQRDMISIAKTLKILELNFSL